MDLILVASNDLRTREDLKAALSLQGWWVAAVEDRQGALQAAADQAPRLVIVDSDLEGALDLVVGFGARNGGPGVLACGGEPDSVETLRLHEAGVDGVVSKPVRAREVEAAVDRVLSGPRMQAAASAPSPARRLTTAEIFGDMLRDLDDGQEPGTAIEAPAAEEGLPAASSADEGLGTGPGREADAPAAEPPPTVPPAPPPAEPAPPLLLAVPDAEPDAPGPPAPSPAAGAGPQESSPALPPEPALAPLPVPPVLAAPPEALPEPAAPPPVAAVEDETGEALPALPAAGGEEAEKRQQAAGLFDETTSPPSFDFGEPLSPPPLPIGLEEPAAPASAPEPASALPAVGPAAASEKSTAEGLRGFGQYQLEERVAVGGMAEVWKARLVGVAGFRKTVALKRILPELTEHRSFVDMFVDEAKLAAGLKHRNIVDIYDLGRIGDDYFIAMEFVEGRDLRRILAKARSLGRPFPLPLAVLIGARLAAALHYAHRQRDPAGRPLGIVHRDVSPRNILVGVEGSVKLCDFGVAKAVTIVSRTQFGALKGKIPYMSPEQARGEAVDSRSDLFSLGTVLFELVTGQRPFVGESEISLLEAVRRCETPNLRDLEPAAPEKLGEIVARALRGDPAERYQSAGDLQRDLDELLRTFRPAPDEEHLAAFVEYLFLPDTAVGGVEERAREATDGATDAPGPPIPTAAEAEVAFELLAAAPPGPDELADGGVPGRSRRWLYGSLAAALLLAAGLAVTTLGRRPPVPGEPPARAAAEAAPASPVAGAPPPAVPDDQVRRQIEALVDEQLDRREEELRRAFEEEEKKLLEELRRLRTDKAPAQDSG